MAAPTYLFGTMASSLGAITPAIPDPHASGDLLLLFMESAGTDVPSAPAGWSEAPGSPADVGTSVTGTHVTVFYKIATSSNETDPAPGDSGNHNIGVVAVISGVRASGYFGATTTGNKGTASTTYSASGITTQDNDSLVIYCIARSDDTASAGFSGHSGTNLTSLTEAFDDGDIVNNGGGLGIFCGTMATAGDTGTLSGTVNSSLNAWWVGEIKSPAATQPEKRPGGKFLALKQVSVQRREGARFSARRR